MLLGKVVMLQPNKEQESKFWQFAGTSRFAWNISLDFYETYRKDNDKLANLSVLMKHLQDLKHNDNNYAWLNTVPEAVTKQAMKDLLRSYSRYYKERKKENYVPYTKKQIEHAKRIGKQLTVYDLQYHPKFHARHGSTPSFYQRTDNIYKTDNTHIKITGIKEPVKCSALKDIDLPEHIKNPRITYDNK